jgi:hypothetical protein
MYCVCVQILDFIVIYSAQIVHHQNSIAIVFISYTIECIWEMNFKDDV